MKHLKNSINYQHKRIKDRTTEIQEYRDFLARILNMRRNEKTNGRESAQKSLASQLTCSSYIVGKLGFTTQSAEKIIEIGDFQFIADNLSEFKDIDHNNVASKIIESGEIDILISFLGKFKGLNENIKSKLEKEGNLLNVIKNLKNFKGLNNDTALKISDMGYKKLVIENFKSFKGLNIKVLISGYFDNDIGTKLKLLIGKSKILDRILLGELLNIGRGESILHYLDKFKLSKKEISDICLGSGITVKNIIKRFLSVNTKYSNDYNGIESYLKKDIGLDCDIVDKFMINLVNNDQADNRLLIKDSMSVSTIKLAHWGGDKKPGLDYYDNYSSNSKFCSTSTMDYYDFEDLFGNMG